MSAIEQPSISTIARRMAGWRARRIIARHGSSYATAHDIGTNPPRLNLKDWPGLLAYVTMTQRQHTRNLLFALWLGPGDFERHSKAFASAVSPPEFEGYLSDPNETWIARAGRVFSYSAVLLTLVAILGAVQTLGSYGSWLFLTPSLHLDTTRPRLRYVASDPVDEIVRIANRTTTPHRGVSIDDAWFENEDKKPLTRLFSASDPFETLASNSSEDVQLAGKAPKTPGTYKLNVAIRSSAGWLRRSRIQPFKKNVEVWAASPRASTFERVATTTTSATFVATLAVGRAVPNGMDCECMVREQPGQPQVFVDYPQMSQETMLPGASMPGKEIAGMRWHAPKNNGFERVPFRVVVSGPGTNVVTEEQLEVNCHATPEPPPH